MTRIKVGGPCSAAYDPGADVARVRTTASRRGIAWASSGVAAHLPASGPLGVRVLRAGVTRPIACAPATLMAPPA